MLTIDVDSAHRVSALLQIPEDARACLVLAHGAGAGMTHPFMEAVAAGLFARRIASLRFQFPYMEQGSKRPDRPALAQASVRSAVAEAARLVPDLPLFAGGKSFGARMTSQEEANAHLPGVRGLVFFGFPLHAAGKPSAARGDHLDTVPVPMLFLQGTKDALADCALMTALVSRLGPKAMLHTFEDADHSFHVPKRSGQTDAQILAQALDIFSAWIPGVSEPA